MAVSSLAAAVSMWKPSLIQRPVSASYNETWRRRLHTLSETMQPQRLTAVMIYLPSSLISSRHANGDKN